MQKNFKKLAKILQIFFLGGGKSWERIESRFIAEIVFYIN